ncbi:MAG: S-adenosyl-l-methionine hydroxide adenosyltransferase family protein [Candidatus Binatia bacterium]
MATFPSPRIITLLTDFGTQDAFVSIMKGVILGINPQVHLVDLSHAVPPQDIQSGALILRSAVPFFPPGTIHVAVVDPGVGSLRRAILVETQRCFFIGPDNGLLSLAVATDSIVRIIHLTNTQYFLSTVSSTFHGRDVFAPVAAHLSRNVPTEAFGPSVAAFEQFSLPPVERTATQVAGCVIAIDRFGNLITNITAADLLPFPTARLSVSIGSVNLQGMASTYASVPVGTVVALINSWGMLEIAVRNGSAAQHLNAHAGALVWVKSM